MTPSEIAERVSNQEVSNSNKNLFDRTTCIKVEISSIGNTKKVKQSQYEVDADKSMTRASKKLLDSKELSAINQLDGDIRRYIEDVCLPFPVKGVHLAPLSRVEEIEDRLQKFEELREQKVDAFLAAYDQAKKEAELRLRALFNPMDYLPIDSLRKRFDFAWDYMAFGEVPAVLKALPKISKSQREKNERRAMEAAAEIQDVRRALLLELVAHLRDMLEPDETGKPKRKMHEAAITKLQDFLFNFGKMNVNDDRDLEAETEAVRDAMAGVDIVALRNTETLREKVREEMAVIADRLKPMVGERPSRKFRKELEEV